MELREYQELFDNKTRESNLAMRNLEEIDVRLSKVNDRTLMCLCKEVDGKIETIKISDFLSLEVMDNLLNTAMAEMKHVRNERARKLDEILGIEREPAVENPVFKPAIKEVVNQANKEEEQKIKVSNRGRKSVIDKLDVKKVQDMLTQGRTQLFIAKTFGVSEGTMCQFIKINNLAKSHKHKAPNEGTGADPNRVQNLLNSGWSDGEIGNKLGISRSRVTNIVKENNLKRPKKAEKPKVNLDELLENNIPEIKALYTNGPFDIKKLAVEYSCDVKELHKFLSEHGLLKPSKKDPFNGK